ncbi:MAG: internal scaffolding protein [Microvirus sp.]|nr:MAG: internal scaffolding protein [Microvirus sp.]
MKSSTSTVQQNLQSQQQQQQLHSSHHHHYGEQQPVHPPLLTLFTDHPHPKLDCSLAGPSKTKQSFKDECDIQTIMSKFQRTGLLDFVNKRAPHYGDVTGINFDDAMDRVIRGREFFADLPSSLRDQFDNSPGEFFEFIANPANAEAMAELGLLPPPTPTGSGASAPKPAEKPSKQVSSDGDTTSP